MKIVIDAMGGDNAPREIVKGACLARDEIHVPLILVGDEAKIRKTACEQNLSLDGISIVHASQVIKMDDPPLSVREKSDSSMRVGFRMLNDGEADAFVSAGSTGAMHAGSTLFVHRIKGIRRSAIATILPLQKPLLLIDSGANTSVTDDHLYQFAVMGSIYMEKIFGIREPAVGLLNNGSESTKGTELQIETYKKLRNSKLNFVGNIEGKDVPFGRCDVLVTDGFTGNILLKLVEGMGSFMLHKMKGIFTATTKTKVGYLLCKDKVRSLKREFDASEYGGAPFLGISKPVIKAHGSSDAAAIKNAIKQAIAYINTGIIEEIADKCSDLIDDEVPAGNERNDK